MAVTKGGGQPIKRDVMNYAQPQGPRFGGGMHTEPGGGTKGETLGEMPGQEFTGSPGLGGDNCGNCGTQGKY